MVLEYLEGETLAQRLTRGPLKHEEALSVAIDVAEALDEAHRAGIVHRNLKPGNIMLTRSGVKLLDFGLAKLRPAAPAVSGLSLAATAPGPVTSQGTILGTLYYMAPEQVEGQEADTRTDMFAFGVVLYEMLTATKAFDGKTQASVIAAILEREPAPLATLQPLTPPLADAIVRKCLAKNAADRWQSAADLASALRWALDGTKASAPAASPPVSRRPAVIGAMAALVLVALAGGWLGWRYASGDTPPAPAVRFEVLPPHGVTLRPSPVASAAQLALAPDGRHLAFVAATKGGPSQIWVRPLDSVQAQPLAGTEGASFPFWSPDSRFIAFFAAGKLKKIDTRGGTPQTLADAIAGRGGTWNQDDVILFTGQANSPVTRISGSGGAVTPVTTSMASRASRRILATVSAGRPPFSLLPAKREGPSRRAPMWPRSTRRRARASSTATRESSTPRDICCSSADGILFAQAFDERTLQTSGELFRLADGVGYWATAFAYTAVTASAPASLRTARVLCPRRVFVGTIARERRSERSAPRVRTARRACRPIKPA